uniref:Prefoldin subunit n=1 Tax=Plectus sambesii TaxID=2011161 RepID=A0A914X8D2_9BILA
MSTSEKTFMTVSSVHSQDPDELKQAKKQLSELMLYQNETLTKEVDDALIEVVTMRKEGPEQLVALTKIYLEARLHNLLNKPLVEAGEEALTGEEYGDVDVEAHIENIERIKRETTQLSDADTDLDQKLKEIQEKNAKMQKVLEMVKKTYNSSSYL